MSLVVWKIEPVVLQLGRTAAALTRLPLWAMAIGPRWCRSRNGWALAGLESPGGGVAHVPDGASARKLPAARRARRRRRPGPCRRGASARRAVGGDDARRLLPAVLQGVERQIGQGRGFRVTEDSYDAAHTADPDRRSRPPTAPAIIASDPQRLRFRKRVVDRVHVARKRAGSKQVVETRSAEAPRSTPGRAASSSRNCSSPAQVRMALRCTIS